VGVWWFPRIRGTDRRQSGWRARWHIDVGLPRADPTHIHYFDQAPGSPFYEIDIKEPPRPYLIDPPMIDLDFIRTVVAS